MKGSYTVTYGLTFEPDLSECMRTIVYFMNRLVITLIIECLYQDQEYTALVSTFK